MNDVTATEIENLLPQESGEQNWRALHFFNLYRIILAGVFTSLYATQIGPNFFAGYDASLFFSVSVSYLGLAITNSFVIRQHLLPFNSQIFLQGGVDIIAITLLMHASGGIVSGLGMLLVMSIAGCSVLTEGRTAVFFAAMASLAVLIETVVITFSQEVEYNFYPQAGLLGAAFFATAFLSFMLARRIRASDALALQRGAHVEYLSQLNEQIVQHIRTGIIVLDIAGRVQLFNDASKRLLGINGNPENYPLSMVSPELAEQVRNWRRGKRVSGGLLRTATSEVELLATFTRLQRADTANVLILLEDATLTAQRAQQLKLASLGRLTASIAHEIRNPLSAISHAAQLLKEGPDMAESDERLLRIIIEHCHRVNTIVENVLQLSRQRRESDSQEFILGPWLHGLTEELCEHYGLSEEDIRLELKNTETSVYFDPNQLRQVIWNLCENALRYSDSAPRVLLNADMNSESGRPYLDVADRGKGMSEEVAAQVFEPFFTTETQGTGLGLYLSREICQANQASLHMLSYDETGCRFRISFSSPGGFSDGPSITSRIS